MPLIYRIDVLQALKEKGYNTNRLRKEKILAESTIQKLRENKPISWENISKICDLLNCQPNFFLENVEDKKLQEESPKPIKNANTETESFEEQLKRIILKRL